MRRWEDARSDWRTRRLAPTSTRRGQIRRIQRVGDEDSADNTYCPILLRNNLRVTDSIPGAALEALQVKHEACQTRFEAVEQELASAKVSISNILNVLRLTVQSKEATTVLEGVQRKYQTLVTNNDKLKQEIASAKVRINT
jgi:hypothetical protein